MAAKTNEIKIAWRPQRGPQLEAMLASWCEELFFGGARGGGKSDFLLGDFAQDIDHYGENWKGILFRKSYKELDDIVARSKQIYPQLGGIFKKGEFTWIFPNGATLKLRHLEREEDAEKYQGHQYGWIGFDELPNWPTADAYLKLKACLRNGAVPIPVKRMRSTGNPGGVGHGWVKDRFIDPCPSGYKPIDQILYVKGGAISKEYIDGYTMQVSTRMFIPSKIQDNQILLSNDPLYISRLAQTGSEALVKAWLSGDWDAIEGAYFDRFDRKKHILPSFVVPAHWYKIRAFDWGYSRPFCVLWGAVSDGSLLDIGGQKIAIPKDAIVIYREFYGTTGKPNEGIKMEASEIAIKTREMQAEWFEKMSDQVADPAIFDVSSGPSIAEQMEKQKVSYRPADNKRVNGWQQVRGRLLGRDKRPMLYITDNCHNLLRTLPIMQYDKTKPEDLDTALEDHAVDTLRYLLMARPITIEIESVSDFVEQWWKDFNPKKRRELKEKENKKYN
jgi:hypothetical protein